MIFEISKIADPKGAKQLGLQKPFKPHEQYSNTRDI